MLEQVTSQAAKWVSRPPGHDHLKTYSISTTLGRVSVSGRLSADMNSAVAPPT